MIYYNLLCFVNKEARKEMFSQDGTDKKEFRQEQL